MIKILLESLTTKYFQFSGRASRKEYWLIYLFYISLGYFTVFFGTNYTIFSVNILYFLFLVLFLFLLPSITVCVRRLHDLNLSGWWFLLINTFIMLGEYFNYTIFYFIAWLGTFLLGFYKGTPTANRYGEPSNKYEAEPIN